MSAVFFRRGKHCYEATGEMRMPAAAEYGGYIITSVSSGEIKVRCTTARYQCDQLPRWVAIRSLKPANVAAKELKSAVKAALALWLNGRSDVHVYNAGTNEWHLQEASDHSKLLSGKLLTCPPLSK